MRPDWRAWTRWVPTPIQRATGARGMTQPGQATPGTGEKADAETQGSQPGLDVTTPNVARTYRYFLDGEDPGIACSAAVTM